MSHSAFLQNAIGVIPRVTTLVLGLEHKWLQAFWQGFGTEHQELIQILSISWREPNPIVLENCVHL